MAKNEVFPPSFFFSQQLSHLALEGWSQIDPDSLSQDPPPPSREVTDFRFHLRTDGLEAGAFQILKEIYQDEAQAAAAFCGLVPGSEWNNMLLNLMSSHLFSPDGTN